MWGQPPRLSGGPGLSGRSDLSMKESRYLSGSLFATKSDTRLAAGGSRFASTAITYPVLGQIFRSPFIPGAPPP